MKTIVTIRARIVVTAHCALLTAFTAIADNAPQPLPFVQDWSNTSLINAENDWAGVPGMIGHRGDKLASKPGLSPQTVTIDASTTPVDVIANQKNPNGLRTGGVAEFDGLPDPTVALKGSGTATAPSLLLNLNTSGKQNIAVGFNLRDIDSSANNAVQAISFQFRVSTNGTFTDLPSGGVADASTGPSLATEVIHKVVLLPIEANNQPHVQVRWVTCNAESNDEWIGVDDIAVIGDDIGKPATASDEPRKSPAKPLRAGKDPTAD